MTLAEYQRTAALYNDENDNIAQIAWIIMDMFNMSYDEVNTMDKRTFLRYSKKIANKFHNIDKKPFWSLFRIETDATKITLGQFIECQHFMKQGEMVKSIKQWMAREGKSARNVKTPVSSREARGRKLRDATTSAAVQVSYMIKKHGIKPKYFWREATNEFLVYMENELGVAIKIDVINNLTQ